MEKAEQKKVELILSKEIIEEFSRVLSSREIQEKIKNKNLEMQRTVEKIVSLSTLVEPTERFKIINEDKDDDKFLDCAVAGKAEMIISQDKHLLKLKVFKRILILKPEEFLKII